MKKWGKIFLGIIALILLIVAGTMTPEVVATTQDLFWFRMSGVMLLVVLICGALIEMNVFKIKKHIPLAKSNQISHHILFWLLCVVLSILAFGGCYSMTSQEFRTASSEFNAQKKAEQALAATPAGDENTQTVVNANTETENKGTAEDELAGNEPVEAEPAETEMQNPDAELENDENSDSTIWPGTVTTEPEQESDEPYLIEKEVYPLENETYTIQGIEITFYSATLERNVKPAGYIVELEYALKNTNLTDATIQFSSHGNELHADGQIVSMAPQATWSKKYQTSYHLKSSETTDSFIAQFFANSSVYGHTTSGTEYQPVDFANLYSDQTLEAVVVISGYQDDNSDSATITLELK